MHGGAVVPERDITIVPTETGGVGRLYSPCPVVKSL